VSIEDNRAQGFRSTVLIDEGFATGHMFDVEGTPSAVVVNKAGNVASPVGGDEVMRLLKQ
jgi:hypothetical protein